jgi:Ras GTPase-activating-like protein IQGAP2/3
MSILKEVEASQTIQDIILGHPMYLSVAIQYIKPKQTAYIRDTLKSIIQEVIEMEDLDLETDPVVVSASVLKLESCHPTVLVIDLWVNSKPGGDAHRAVERV